VIGVFFSDYVIELSYLFYKYKKNMILNLGYWVCFFFEKIRWKEMALHPCNDEAQRRTLRHYYECVTTGKALSRKLARC
jgi:hypothetical protein